ncbi:TlyA family RNA methyltransferase [Dethiosulfovibrio sp. F2B]|uniref:TlyA family RNA methyltransferase n=1 Tax=Dethiosulfovibrio faecalis TaxID=2720018 RepID=UPI001F304845|nr:TlyA family RNA methyltransferase [Dethiosulfovibrio faecalis]
MKKRKERLDKRMVELGLSETRSRAQAVIMSGEVLLNGEVADKAGTPVDLDDLVELKAKGRTEWASRGAYKLLGGLEAFPVSPEGRVCLDVGASTGGFTDVLLSRGAEKVYAVDVGYGQLHWRLRTDPRVVIMERTNARYIVPEDFSPLPSLAVMDASFISIRLLLPALERILPDGGEILTLVKPQFEAGRDRIGKGGVVKSSKLHLDILRELNDFISSDTNLGLRGCIPSPIKGPKGNVEFLFYLVKGVPSLSVDLAAEVEKAHEGEMDG